MWLDTVASVISFRLTDAGVLTGGVYELVDAAIAL